MRVVLSLIAVTACGGGDRLTALERLQPGDCITMPSRDVQVAGAEVTRCTGPHQYEVAGRYTLRGGREAYPGSRELGRDAYEDCRPIFRAHVGAELYASAFDIVTVTPSASSWDQGDRDVLCLVVRDDRAPLTAPVAGGGPPSPRPPDQE